MKKTAILFSLMFVNLIIIAQNSNEKTTLLSQVQKYIASNQYKKALDKLEDLADLSETYPNEYFQARAIISSRLEQIKRKNSIHWVSVEEAIELQKKVPKKIMIFADLKDHRTLRVNHDLYLFDLSNQDLVKYVNDNFYAVKLIRNQKAKVSFNNHKATANEFINALGISSFPSLAFLNEKTEFVTSFNGFFDLKDLEFNLKYIGNDSFLKIKTEPDYLKFKDNFKYEFVEYYTNAENFNSFEKKDYIAYIKNQPKKALSKITKNFIDLKGIQSLDSKCGAIYNQYTQTLQNEKHCSSKLWLENIPLVNEAYLPYEFELNFSLTPEFKDIDTDWPLQIMLGNSPAGYTWLAVDKKGMFYLSYNGKDGFQDLLQIFKADKIYLDKPNHVKFVYFPNGYYYLEVNSYKCWSFDFEEERIQKIPALGVSNRIVFYSDIVIDEMSLNTFEE